MRIVISVAQSQSFENSNACSPINQICDHVGAAQGESLLMPQPGRLMDLIRILNENDIAYDVQESPGADAMFCEDIRIDSV